MTLRTDRVGEAIREILAEEIIRMGDPRFELLAITGVDVFPDLAHAIVYFSSSQSEEAGRALESARKRLQAKIASSLHAKRTPDLRFSPDVGIIQGERIDALLRDYDVPLDEAEQ